MMVLYYKLIRKYLFGGLELKSKKIDVIHWIFDDVNTQQVQIYV